SYQSGHFHHRKGCVISDSLFHSNFSIVLSKNSLRYVFLIELHKILHRLEYVDAFSTIWVVMVNWKIASSLLIKQPS
uniref:Uncharacterized protein n=1 Tax=Acanthochromis polyacanthus TaxID=80966 RepID=A0A3Q1FPC5_9TELE